MTVVNSVPVVLTPAEVCKSLQNFCANIALIKRVTIRIYNDMFWTQASQVMFTFPG